MWLQENIEGTLDISTGHQECTVFHSSPGNEYIFLITNIHDSTRDVPDGFTSPDSLKKNPRDPNPENQIENLSGQIWIPNHSPAHP